MTIVPETVSTETSFTASLKTLTEWPNSQGFNSEYCENSPIELKVKGNIPAWAAGVLYRSGTGASEVETDSGETFKVHHWFDALSIVHRFQILAPHSEHGSVRVLYNSRSTCDGLIEKIRWVKVMSTFQPGQPQIGPDDSNMSVTLTANFPGLSARGEKQQHGHASGIQTLCNKTDASRIQILKGQLSSAHAKSDPITGDVFNFNLEFGIRPTYRIFRVSASTGETSILATLHADAAYIHSFFLSKHYVVLCIWNSFFKTSEASVLFKDNFIDSLADYDSSRPAQWYVVDRRSIEEGGQGLIAIYESDPFFCYHTINAFEETTADGSSTEIVADLVTYPNLDTLKRLFLPNLISTSSAAATLAHRSNLSIRPELKRFRLPFIPSSPVQTAQKATLELTSEPFKCPELPTINPSYVLQPHRYVYGLLDTCKSTFFDSLVKYDTKTGATLTWSQHGQTAGEAIFVPRPRETEANNEQDEDNGILLSVVLDGPVGRSYLLALDPKTMTETGRAELDGVVGFGFHGTHISYAGKSEPNGRSLDV